jgi:acyl-CoA oxidase
VQFGERIILDYITHQRRLFIGLASTYALHCAMLHLKQLLEQVGDRRSPAPFPEARAC